MHEGQNTTTTSARCFYSHCSSLRTQRTLVIGNQELLQPTYSVYLEPLLALGLEYATHSNDKPCSATPCSILHSCCNWWIYSALLPTTTMNRSENWNAPKNILLSRLFHCSWIWLTALQTYQDVQCAVAELLLQWTNAPVHQVNLNTTSCQLCSIIRSILRPETTN